MEPLNIGDSSRDGLLMITDTSWDNNGTLRVTVAEMIGGHAWSISERNLIRRMRRLARRALPYPEHTRSSRLVSTWYANGQQYATFAVSRND